MPKIRGTRPALPGASESRTDIDAMVRVDLAGELGALRIYEGQLAVLSRDPSAAASAAAIARMAAQERVHFDAFSAMARERGVRPTALEPLWHIAGYALGAATALMGEKAAMACTVAVEDAIDEHYSGQIAKLTPCPEETELKTAVERFRGDELAHRDEALRLGGAEAPFYEMLSAVIRSGCRAAIRLSERI